MPSCADWPCVGRSAGLVHLLVGPGVRPAWALRSRAESCFTGPGDLRFRFACLSLLSTLRFQQQCGRSVSGLSLAASTWSRPPGPAWECNRLHRSSGSEFFPRLTALPPFLGLFAMTSSLVNLVSFHIFFFFSKCLFPNQLIYEAHASGYFKKLLEKWN